MKQTNKQRIELLIIKLVALYFEAPSEKLEEAVKIALRIRDELEKQ